MQSSFSHGDSNLYGMGAIPEFPQNVRQIGQLDENIRVYMEDYVYTYLCQFARANKTRERLAVIAGIRTRLNDLDAIVISGAIQGKYTENINGRESFTKKSEEYIEQQMNVYFRGLSVLGWVHTQPGYGTFLMAGDEQTHLHSFTEDYQILFVIDPLEKQEKIYIKNRQGRGMKELKGYFIYYDKNERMQDYMLENSLVKPKLAEPAVAQEQAEAETAPDIAEDKARQVGKADSRESADIDRIDAAGRIRKTLKRREEQAKAKAVEHYTALVCMSAALCVACGLMAAGLVNSRNRINMLETEVVSVKTTYYDLARQFKDAGVQSAFAAQADEEAAKLNAQMQEEQAKAAEEARAAAQEAKEAAAAAAKAVEEARAAEASARAAEKARAAETDGRAAESGASATDTAEDAVMAVYKVEQGDTLGHISMKFYGDLSMVDRLREVNGLPADNTIYYGKELKIPER